jgi:hypothetical protein
MRVVALGTSPVGELLARYPVLRDVLSWYGVDLEARHEGLSLREICQRENLDVDRVVIDLQNEIEDLEDTDLTDLDDWE